MASHTAPRSSWGHVGLEHSRPSIDWRPDGGDYYVIAIIALVTCWVATQFVASRFHFAPALGQPLIWHIYWPHAGVIWWLRFDFGSQQAIGQVFVQMWAIILSGVVVGAYIVCAMSMSAAKKKLGTADLHGSAHFAIKSELSCMGLLPQWDALFGLGLWLRRHGFPRALCVWLCERGTYAENEGLYLGSWTDPDFGITNYLRHSGPEHVLVYGPTRSGKGVGPVLANLLDGANDWSTLTFDIKGENYQFSAGYRAALGHRVAKFEPLADDGSSVRWNPLDMVEIGTEREVGQAQKIIETLMDPEGKAPSSQEAHWIATGSALFVATILHLKYMAARPPQPDSPKPHPATLAGIYQQLSDPRYENHQALYAAMAMAEHDPEGSYKWVDSLGNPTKTHPTIAACMTNMLGKQPGEESGVLSTGMRFLNLYMDPVIARNTTSSDFSVDDLVNGAVPMDLYIVVPPGAKHTLKPLTRLLVNAVIGTLTREMKFEGTATKRNKHKLLLVLDEFCSGLGRLEIFSSALAYIAGYGIRALLIVQDSVQLQDTYGREESITSNCGVRVVFTPNRIETAKLISDTLGRTTVHRTVNRGGKPSIEDMGRDLLTPDEVMRLPGPTRDRNDRIVELGDVITFVGGHPPVLGKQIVYSMDPVLAARAAIAPPKAVRVPESNLDATVADSETKPTEQSDAAENPESKPSGPSPSAQGGSSAAATEPAEEEASDQSWPAGADVTAEPPTAMETFFASAQAKAAIDEARRRTLDAAQSQSHPPAQEPPWVKEKYDQADYLRDALGEGEM